MKVTAEAFPVFEVKLITLITAGFQAKSELVLFSVKLMALDA